MIVRNPNRLWDLPEDVLFHVVSYAAPATRRAGILCHSIARLCQASYGTTILGERDRSARLWDMILEEDYSSSIDSSAPTPKKVKSSRTGLRQRVRRSPAQRVRDAHTSLVINTGDCFIDLWDMARTRGGLSRSNLVDKINEYGPHLRINDVVSTGDLFLVEVCDAIATEAVILECVREHVEQRGAIVDMCTNQPPDSMNALWVAARPCGGWPLLVEYLLHSDADATIACSGRFGLRANPRREIQCDNATPLQFASSVIEAEQAEGANDRILRGLAECIRLLDGVTQRAVGHE
jgi:hypothetical protein